QVGDRDLVRLRVGECIVAGGRRHGRFRGRRSRGVGCVALATGQDDGETEGKQESAHGHPGEWTGSPSLASPSCAPKSPRLLESLASSPSRGGLGWGWVSVRAQVAVRAPTESPSPPNPPLEGEGFQIRPCI